MAERKANEPKKLPPERWKSIFLRHLLPYLLTLAIFSGVGIAIDQYRLAILAWNIFIVGYGLGSILAYRNGMNDEREIIEMIYGDEWDRDAVLGKLLRSNGEPIQPQRYKEVREIAQQLERHPE